MVCPPRELQPDDDRVERKFAHSLRLVLPRITAPASRSRVDHERVGRRAVVRQRQRAGGIHHAGDVDVVLDQDRDAVQRPAHLAGLALRIERGGIGDRLADSISITESELRTGIVDLRDAIEIRLVSASDVSWPDAIRSRASVALSSTTSSAGFAMVGGAATRVWMHPTRISSHAINNPQSAIDLQSEIRDLTSS